MESQEGNSTAPAPSSSSTTPSPSPPPPEKSTPESPKESSPSPPPPKNEDPPDSSPSPPPPKASSPPPATEPKTPTPTPSPSPPPPATEPKTPSPSPPPPSSSTNPPPTGTPSTPAPKENLPPPPPREEPTPTLGPPSTHRPPPGRETQPTNTKQTSAPQPSQDDGGNQTALIVGCVAGGLLIIAMIVIFVMCNKKKKKKTWPGNNYYDTNQNWYGPQSMEQSNNGPPQPPPGYMGPPGGARGHNPAAPQMTSSGETSSNLSDPHQAGNPVSSNLSLGFNKSTFTYDELSAATDGFAQANLLGQGGFGYVHKGVLPNGKVVAVKSLKSGSGQGEREFQAEVDIISRVHHRHLVSLVGYCIAGLQRMLVYEFVSNKTLEFHLHGNGGTTLDWPKRLTIAIGSAKGLAYLHEDCHPRIIHRDIKAANILLDNNYEAMVADFGLAKLSQDNFTHVSTRVMGTFGYLAPEYASSGKLTEKSDVFSFGVMLLELITGRRPVDSTNKYMDDSLVDWARPILTTALADEDYDEIVDPRLHNVYNHNEIARMIACASASIRHSAKRRPKMSQIVRTLEGDASLEDLSDGIKANNSSSSNLSSEYNTRAYNEDLKKFRKMAFDSQGDGDTSTYGLNPSASSDASASRDMRF
ncbi:Receptor-like kinase [Thalictrum thalictroides]|uniref:non-specific serine/threonine protein kinase n=1 Tax=Thalictrum thalictroides TaxID=46969 RepID=A0A7J6WUV6_THATH|nr:Receptor-like kinase [Thalictrum thalictroides]